MNEDDLDEEVKRERRTLERERLELERRPQRENGFEPAIEMFEYEISKCLEAKRQFAESGTLTENELESLDTRITLLQNSIYEMRHRKEIRNEDEGYSS